MPHAKKPLDVPIRLTFTVITAPFAHVTSIELSSLFFGGVGAFFAQKSEMLLKAVGIQSCPVLFKTSFLPCPPSIGIAQPEWAFARTAEIDAAANREEAADARDSTQELDSIMQPLAIDPAREQSEQVVTGRHYGAISRAA
jgi:hypothetical protein